MQKILLRCPLCKTRRTSSDRCWRCKKRVPDERKTYGTGERRKAPTPRKQDLARSENQEAKEDEAAERINTQPIFESRPCHRCGRLVEVQMIPPEERRKLGSLPVAVECERPCAVRI